jgi:purine-binding chemotaxis protein CheW
MDITDVPRTPDYVRGVINLRGRVLPIIDLRSRFRMDTVEDTDRTCIIVVQVRRGGRTLTLGVVIDQVSEVLHIKAEQIEATPDLGSSKYEEFIRAMGKVHNQVVMLLDIDRVISSGEGDIENNFDPHTNE